MLNELLKSNTVPGQTDVEHPLNHLGVNEWLQPKSNKDIFGTNNSTGGNAIRRKLLKASTAMNQDVLSKMKERLLVGGGLNKELVNIVGKAPTEDSEVEEGEAKPMKSSARARQSLEEEEGGDYINLDDFEPTGDLTNNQEMAMFHDCKNKYECLETFIGGLGPGCGFGEMAMQVDNK
jgi:hypothetical protein